MIGWSRDHPLASQHTSFAHTSWLCMGVGVAGHKDVEVFPATSKGACQRTAPQLLLRFWGRQRER
eukprot:5066843-Prorocentrum_lima.AAC.1